MRKLLPLLACLALFSAVAFAADNAMTGYIVDSKCGAKGAHEGAEACSKKCLESGAKPVFVSDRTKAVLPISNPEAIKGHEGHHVNISGTIDNGSLTVENVEMASADSAEKPEHENHHQH